MNKFSKEKYSADMHELCCKHLSIVDDPYELGITLLEAICGLELRLKEMTEYADKLAEGLPVGMLPADIDNLRSANASLAQENHELKQIIDNLKQ